MNVAKLHNICNIFVRCFENFCESVVFREGILLEMLVCSLLIGLSTRKCRFVTKVKIDFHGLY